MEPLGQRPRPVYDFRLPEITPPNSQLVEETRESGSKQAPEWLSESDEGGSTSSGEPPLRLITNHAVSKRRRGRPRKDKAILPPEDPILCRWRDCRARLMNLEVFGKHLNVVHLRTRVETGYRCGWEDCVASAAPRERQNGILASEPFYTESARDMVQHTLGRHVHPVRREKEEYIAPWQRDIDESVMVPTILPGLPPKGVPMPLALIDRPSIEDEWMDVYRTQPFIGRPTSNWYREDIGLPKRQKQEEAAVQMGLREPVSIRVALQHPKVVLSKESLWESAADREAKYGPEEGFATLYDEINSDFEEDIPTQPDRNDEEMDSTPLSPAPDVVITTDSQELIQNSNQEPFRERPRPRKITGRPYTSLGTSKSSVDESDYDESLNGHVRKAQRDSHSPRPYTGAKRGRKKRVQNPPTPAAIAPTEYRGKGRPRFSDLLGSANVPRPKKSGRVSTSHLSREVEATSVHDVGSNSLPMRVSQSRSETSSQFAGASGVMTPVLTESIVKQTRVINIDDDDD